MELNKQSNKMKNYQIKYNNLDNNNFKMNYQLIQIKLIQMNYLNKILI